MNMKLVMIILILPFLMPIAPVPRTISCRSENDQSRISQTYRVHNLDTGLNYTTIQEAIDASETWDGHTIFVEEGTYSEHVAVNKSLTIIGQNENATIIDGNGTGVVVHLQANNTIIKGFTIRAGENGILTWYCFNCSISDIRVFDNQYGIRLYDSSNCSISKNNVTANDYGIHVESSDGNNISYNDFSLNGMGITLAGESNSNYVAHNVISRRTNETVTYGVGVYLYSQSQFNWIAENDISDVNYGVFFDGGSWNNMTENVISSCFISSVTIYLAVHNSIVNNVIEESGTWSTYGVEINGGQSNQLLQNRISRRGNGLYLRGSSSWNSIQGNQISESGNGLYVQSLSHDNNITQNTFQSNICGIRIDGDSDNNTIYNNFVNSSQYQVICSEDSTNAWDNGTRGNYWSDYKQKYPNATEIDDSGIWNMPYIIDSNNMDNYPIVPEFPTFIILPVFFVATILAVMVSKRKYARRESIHQRRS